LRKLNGRQSSQQLPQPGCERTFNPSPGVSNLCVAERLRLKPRSDICDAGNTKDLHAERTRLERFRYRTHADRICP
jgi:hypothetical protein